MQNDLPTIELALEEAISRVTKQEVNVYSSGRTDKGVHALGQVIHFDTSLNITPNRWVNAINTYLPDDIRIIDAKIVDDTFHARFSALQKEYRYYIINGDYNIFMRNYRAFYKDLDIDLMKEALKKFEGTHNFKGFCSGSVDERKDFTKTIYEASLNVVGNELEFIFRGTGFLKYQIRRMMGLIIEIGLHRDNLDKIDLVFEKKDPEISHKKAPAEGLYLYKVYYEERYE